MGCMTPANMDKMNFMNKKADVSITLLVFMIVILTGFTLFSFVKSSLTSVAGFDDVRFVENAYSWEEGIRFDLVGAGEGAFIKSYSELLSQNPFDKTQAQIDFDMKNNFSAYFNNEEIIKSRYSGNKFDVGVDTNVLELKTKLMFSESFIAEERFVGLSYDYSFDKKFYLKDYGLYSVDEIRQKSEKCLSEKDDSKISRCLEFELPNFTPQVGNDKEVNFTSKKMYLIDGGLKSISFSFR